MLSSFLLAHVFKTIVGGDIHSIICRHTCGEHKNVLPWKITSLPIVEFLSVAMEFPYLLFNEDIRLFFRLFLKSFGKIDKRNKLFIGVYCCEKSLINCYREVDHFIVRSFYTKPINIDVTCGFQTTIILENSKGEFLRSVVAHGSSYLTTQIRISMRFLNMLNSTLFQPKCDDSDFHIYDSYISRTRFAKILGHYAGEIHTFAGKPKPDWHLEFRYDEKNWFSPYSLRNTSSADPFFAADKNEIFCFFESFQRNRSQGKISMVKFSETSNLKQKLEVGHFREIIVEKFHLSFPFIFQQNNRWYILPEASRSGRMPLYSSKSLEGPWNFDFDLNIPEILIDSIVFFTGQKFILIGSRRVITDLSGSNVLVAYESLDLKSQWRLIESFHEWSDLSSRNGGFELISFNRFVRYSQSNCMGIYGHHVNQHHYEIAQENGIQLLKTKVDFLDTSKIRSHHYSSLKNIECRDRFFQI